MTSTEQIPRTHHAPSDCTFTSTTPRLGPRLCAHPSLPPIPHLNPNIANLGKPAREPPRVAPSTCKRVRSRTHLVPTVPPFPIRPSCPSMSMRLGLLAAWFPVDIKSQDGHDSCPTRLSRCQTTRSSPSSADVIYPRNSRLLPLVRAGDDRASNEQRKRHTCGWMGMIHSHRTSSSTRLCLEVITWFRSFPAVKIPPQPNSADTPRSYHHSFLSWRIRSVKPSILFTLLDMSKNTSPVRARVRLYAPFDTSATSLLLRPAGARTSCTTEQCRLLTLTFDPVPLSPISATQSCAHSHQQKLVVGFSQTPAPTTGLTRQEIRDLSLKGVKTRAASTAGSGRLHGKVAIITGAGPELAIGVSAIPWDLYMCTHPLRGSRPARRGSSLEKAQNTFTC
jgi:hypothetical protein